MSFENRHPGGYFARFTLMSPRCTTSICTPPFSTCSPPCSSWPSPTSSRRRCRDPIRQTARPSNELAHDGRDAADLAARDLGADLVDGGHVGMRHLRADLPEADAVVLQAEDRVAAAAELPFDDILDRQEHGLVDVLRRARQDVRA